MSLPMFDRLLSLLTGATPYQTPIPPADAKHALGALMVRAAKADSSYLFEELQQIDRLLAKLYDLNPVEAAKLRAECEVLEKQMPETEDLAGIVHDAVGPEAREAAVLALWQVVFADGIEHAAEDRLLHQIEDVLGVSPDISRRLHDTARDATT